MDEPASVARLAKLAVPEPSRVVARPRLFECIDDARSRGNVVWVAAPAGSGKTTLLASYLRARRIRAAWYRADATDDDAASFFFHFGQIVADPAALPDFSAEYLAGPGAFARHWSRRFFALAPKLQALVLDDLHEIAADSPVHVALRELIAETPRSVLLVVASRREPPPLLTRLRTLDTFTMLDRDALRLTEDEAVAVGRERLGNEAPDDAALRELHRRTHGWLAGLVLMLESRAVPLGDADASADPLVFDYFAGELLSHCDARMQRFLVLAALLPQLTPHAAASITGMDDAAQLLADLDRRNFFVMRHRTPDGAGSYGFHPLFRLFLLHEGSRRLSADELRAAKRKAASLLADDGDAGGSIALLRETGDWSQVVSMVLRQAPELVRRGRFRTLADWVEKMPPEYREDAPWLDYFLGTCRLPFDPMQARELLSRAYRGMSDRRNAVGAYVAWAGIIDTFIYAWNDFSPADPWIEEFDALRARHPEFPSLDTEVRAIASIFAILMYRRPDDPALPRWAARVEALLSQDIDPTLRMLAANHLVLYYHWWIGRVDAGNEIIARMEPFATTKAVGPFVRTVWDGIAAIAAWMNADHEAAAAAVARGLALAEETGTHLWEFMLLGQGAFTALSNNDPDSARTFLRRMQSVHGGERRLEGVQYHFASFQEAVQRGDPNAMREHAQAGLACAIATGVSWGEAYTRPALAQSLFEDGDEAGARAELARALRVAESIGCANGVYYVRELEAQFADARGEREARLEAIRALFAIMRERGFVNSAWWRNDVMSRLCALALEHDVESGFVQRLVRLRRLPPPDAAAARLQQWPWNVRVRTLGRWSVEIDGEPLRFSGKVQKRPLELLKALIALGGRAVHETQLAEALWPDAEGDDAHNAFVTTLQRLRKLLGMRDALLLQEGRLSLNPRSCWIDTWAFESIDVQGGDAEELRRATSLYRGTFLAGEEPPWAIAPRERLRARFVRAAGALAGRYAAQQRCDDAIACLEGALQIDDTVEPFYQQLMSLHADAGRGADVQRAYRRCRDVLAATLQLRPSPSTDALLSKLASGAPGLPT